MATICPFPYIHEFPRFAVAAPLRDVWFL